MAAPQVDVHGTLGAAERAAVLALIEAATEADGFRALSDQKWLSLFGAGGPGDHQLSLLAWVPAGGKAEGPPIGYGQLALRRDGWALEVVVHPDHRDDACTVEELLAQSAVGEVERRNGGDLRWWKSQPSTEHHAMTSRLGFVLERELLQLRVRLPLPPEIGHHDPTVAVRPFVVGRDEAAWVTANDRAFAGHPEQGGWRTSDLVAREHEPWFDPDGFLLHEVDGQLAAFCWTKVHHETRPILGEIYVIAVDPEFQGRGLGRALAVDGLNHLATQGITEGMLYVDAANAAALGLYRSLGFVVNHADRAYLRHVTPTAKRPEPDG